MRAKLIREKFEEDSDPITDMGIGSYYGIAKKMFPNEIIAFYHADTDEFEYNQVKRIYTVTSNIRSFLNTKDVLIYVKDNKALGYIGAKTMASYLGHGSVYVRLNLYKNI